MTNGVILVERSGLRLDGLQLLALRLEGRSGLGELALAQLDVLQPHVQLGLEGSNERQLGLGER